MLITEGEQERLAGQSGKVGIVREGRAKMFMTDNANGHPRPIGPDNAADEKFFASNRTDSGNGGALVIGESRKMRDMLRQAELVASTDSTVLIRGESGTGKGLVATMIHNLSSRCHHCLVKLNCAAIPLGLLESELFGHQRGAFTGAIAPRVGRFEQADKGTLFLDEIGDIPIELQPKLLRVLQEQEFERLGSSRTTRVSVRLIAATHRNLGQMIGEGKFRVDLYYRLNVFPITAPPLREHSGDIPQLVWHFVERFARRMNKGIETVPVEVMEALTHQAWPGNVRELENFIERSVILSRGPVLEPPLSELTPSNDEAAGEPVTLKDAERAHILRILREAGGVASTAATRLGVPRSTLFYKMRRLGIGRPGTQETRKAVEAESQFRSRRAVS
jgi:formate hydrogenlyase transcriptional activator